MADFYSIWTNIGKAKLANKVALNQKLVITQMALGDGGKDDESGSYQPSEAQETLKRERYRGDISYIEIDAENANWLNTVMTIPPDIGGFFICEVGLFDDEGDMIAVASVPVSYKPVLDEGASKDITIKITTVVSNTENVTLKVNPLTIIATIQDVNAAKESSKAYTDAQVAVVNQRIHKHYTSFAEVNEAFDATTPIVTLFQAMQPNSILNCVVNQANSVYPSAQGSLNLTKIRSGVGGIS